MQREQYDYWLSNINGIGARKIEDLHLIYENSEAIFKASKTEHIHKTNLKQKEIEALIASKDQDKICKEYAKLEQSDIAFISIKDERYPSRLRNIPGAPFSIYVKGKLPPNWMKTLAIIGARECSGYGKEMAKYLSGAIAKEGIGIISGLARGIDAYAHFGALEVGGYTYGVLGCGIDICYPRENINLYMDMQKEGAIISEFAPGKQPLACNFPMRNRIISGLSDGVLVIEAREKSGSLITVDMGLEQGKDIYALPGRITDMLSGGCNNLIKMGAKLVSSPDDILEDFQIICNPINTDKLNDNLILSQEEKIVYHALDRVPKHIEEITLETKVPTNELMERLLSLELRDIIKQDMKNYYVIK